MVRLQGVKEPLLVWLYGLFFPLLLLAAVQLAIGELELRRVVLRVALLFLLSLYSPHVI